MKNEYNILIGITGFPKFALNGRSERVKWNGIKILDVEIMHNIIEYSIRLEKKLIKVRTKINEVIIQSQSLEMAPNQVHEKWEKKLKDVEEIIFQIKNNDLVSEELEKLYQKGLKKLNEVDHSINRIILYDNTVKRDFPEMYNNAGKKEEDFSNIISCQDLSFTKLIVLIGIIIIIVFMVIDYNNILNGEIKYIISLISLIIFFFFLVFIISFFYWDSYSTLKMSDDQILIRRPFIPIKKDLSININEIKWINIKPESYRKTELRIHMEKESELFVWYYKLDRNRLIFLLKQTGIKYTMKE